LPLSLRDGVRRRGCNLYFAGRMTFLSCADRKTLNTPESVTSAHSAGALATLLYSGNFGAGAHDIGVSFVNDAYGGSSTTDRNLYVGTIGYDGNTFNPTGVAIMSNSTVHFTVHG
jgi:hypothetical protein